MIIFFIKNILTPIFSVIFKISIYSSLIGILICIIRKIFENKISTKIKIIIWYIFLLSIICLFVCTIKNNEDTFFGAKFLSEYSENLEEKLFLNEKDIKKFESSIEKQIPILEILNVLSILYFILIIYKIFDFFYILKIKKFEISLEKVLEYEYEILENLKQKLKINKKIELIKIKDIKSAMISGIFEIKIYIPEKVCFESLNCFLIHELCHYKRKDNILKLIIEIIKIVNFFNPLINVILENFENDIELQTDNLAVKYMDLETKKKYCYLLLGEENNEISKR